MGTSLAIILAGLLIWAAIHLYNDIRKVRNWQVDPATSLNLLKQDTSLDVGGPIEAVATGLSGEAACHTASEAGNCEATGVGIGHAVGHLGHFFHH
ncbi:hypothetical protein ACFE35_04245 [Phormidesmis priestleyi ANT.L61.2]